MAASHPIRKLVRRFGVDIHRIRKAPEPIEYLKTLGIRTVIDVGANIGQFAQEIRGLLPDAMIYSFEPLRDCYEQLQQTMRTDARFKAFNAALGAEAGEASIHRSSYSPSSSLLAMADLHKKLFPHTSGDRPESIAVKRMDEVFKDIPLESKLLVKMDVQGYEDRVIEGGRETLAKAGAILLEASFVRLYEGQPLFADIFKLLEGLGFSYHGAMHQKQVKSGEILFEDALFLRTH